MNEWPRLLPLADLGRAPVQRTITAGMEERAALARRFDLPALDRLEASLLAERIGAGVAVNGRLRAEGAQACSVSGAPVRFVLDEPVALRFEPFDEPAAADAEIELAAEDLDVMPLPQHAIDLGEETAQALAAALDPYPRADEATLAAARALLVTEEELARARNPFAVLGQG